MATSPSPRAVTPHGILVDRLDRLVEAAGQPDVDITALHAALAETRALAAGLAPYLEAHASPPSPALAALAQATAAEDWHAHHAAADTAQALEQEMLSGHIESQTLKMLVAATGAKRVLEVGLFTGYSALAMAEGLPDEGELVACEIDDFAADFAAAHFKNAPHGDRITIRRGSAADTLAALATDNTVFDFVFIDADKAGYIDYLNAIVDGGLLAANGLICVDNTLMQGQPWAIDTRSANGEAIAAFNDAVMADPRLESVLLPLRDGLTLIRRCDD